MPPKKVYKKLDPITHILERSDMYVGSKRLKKIEEYIATKDKENFKIIKKYINSSPAILRIFVEVLSNAVDNVERSKKTNTPCTTIRVNIDKETGETSVWNDGDIIPIEIHAEEKIYNHSLIFGHLMAGSNYDDEEERLVAGRNGLGGKLCNIFSTKFIIKGLDPNNGKILEQTWTNNMRNTTEPIITSTKLKTGFTKITYFPDFKQFELEEYSDDIMELYTKYIIDSAMLTKIKVYLNDELIPVNNLETYSQLYETISDEKLLIKNKQSEVLICPANINEFQHISFVNGVYTRLGGVHVDTWSEGIFRPLVEKFNKKDKPQLNIKDIKQFFRIFVVSTIPNPEFSSQDKCVDPNTKILMWDGTTKYAKDLKIGDTVISSDGLPSNIIKLCNGKDKMYSVVQEKYSTYTVNSKHKLVLCCPFHKQIRWHDKIKQWVVGWFDYENLNYRFKRFKINKDEDEDEDKNIKLLLANKFLDMIDDNNIFDIEIEKYIKLNKGTKRKLSGIKSTVVQWPEQDILIDPYILGMWLGDGMQKGNSFSSDDLELVEKWKNWGNINDILITKYSKYYYGIISKSGKLNNINHKYLKNPFKTNLEKYNLTNDKRIPKEYIINSRENRLKLLAGIVDTDGCVQDTGTTLVIVQGLNHSKLIEDIILLVKSLGFTCYHRIKNTQWKEYKTNNIKNGKAHHLHISGKLEDIPVLLQRKKGVSPKIKNVHLSNIKKIIPQEEGEYIGFELDRNNRFLLGDFTVTHNCKLEAPKINVEVKQADINKLLKWSVIEEINDIIKMKEMSVLKKSEKKKKGYTKIEGLDPANNAGGKLGYQCSLILCEGLSAKTYAVAGIQKGVYDKAGRDFFGVMPLSGKLLNCRNSIPTTIAKNKVITNLIQTLNLRHDLDYTEDNNYKTLSYGKVILLCDADVDGLHISGLLMNFFHYLFPSLLEREDPFLVSMCTPIVRVFNPKGDILFYDENKFREFAKEQERQNKTFKSKYYKGLGTTKPEDVPDTFGLKMVEYINDDNSTTNMNKIFHKKFADTRKDWLANYDPNPTFSLDDEGEIVDMEISSFLNTEVIKFSHNDCKRSIPCLFDGLKESQRKILYAVKKRNLTYNKQSLKVAQLGGYVAEHTNYHHGEQNLFETIINMAQDYVGSNNIPLFYRDGMMGTRLVGGKDSASPRYIFTKMETLTPLIFREEDDILLEHVIDDGDVVEPKFYIPILPMILVNGALGIGTGWSSSIPCYNPLDIIECIKIWLDNDGEVLLKDPDDGTMLSMIPEINPWYRGFEGTIEKSDKKYITYGVINKNKDKVEVTELPIGMWTDKFKETAEDWLVDKKIKNMKNYSTPKKVNFLITESDDGFSCNINNMGLYSYLHTTNMVLFNEKEQLKKYSIDEIINEFCIVRYKFYSKRKNHIISTIEKDLRHLGNKERFIQEIIDGKLKIMNIDEEVIIKELEKRKYDKESKNEDPEQSENKNGYNYLLKLPVRTLTADQVKKIKNDIQSLKTRLDNTKKISEKQMWLNDLKEFENEYHKWLKNMNENDTKNKKINKKK